MLRNGTTPATPGIFIEQWDSSMMDMTSSPANGCRSWTRYDSFRAHGTRKTHLEQCLRAWYWMRWKKPGYIYCVEPYRIPNLHAHETIMKMYAWTIKNEPPSAWIHNTDGQWKAACLCVSLPFYSTCVSNFTASWVDGRLALRFVHISIQVAHLYVCNCDRIHPFYKHSASAHQARRKG
jgi:hypothetical protein